MLGERSEILAAAVTLVAAVAAFTDLRKGKIYNWLTLPAWVLGVAASGALGSWQGALEAFGASMLGLVLLGWMFPLKLMGAGDIKLLAALGAWGGYRFVLETGLLSILLGGVFALAILAWNGKLRSFWNRMAIFGAGLAAPRGVPRALFPDLDRKLKMPFGIPIAAAAIWLSWGEPLRWLGVWGSA